MATITIRNLNSEVVEGLKEIAKREKVSMEQMARRIIAERVRNRKAILNSIEESWKKNLKNLEADKIMKTIRTGRSRRI
ncbi:MAG: ribbon-helix-helix protein, CopG family [Deltaproteobacteria bacterium]|nr:ribbon-helix-helix protein, CopG family [Deltaproteobacteria bacterium]